MAKKRYRAGMKRHAKRSYELKKAERLVDGDKKDTVRG